MEPFIGMIVQFGGNFAPKGWALCDGQLLPIASNSALFSILGTTYGGDGRSTFALPDLRGRVAIHPGHGPGLSNYRLGQKGGAESVTLTIDNLPSHNHSLMGVTSGPNVDTLADHSLASALPGNTLYSDAAPNTALQINSVGKTGGSQSVGIIQPYLSVNFIIALVGLFPSRS